MPPPLRSVKYNTAPVVNLDLHQQEKELILCALKKTGGNKAEAARLLNIHRRTIYNRIKKYSLGFLTSGKKE